MSKPRECGECYACSVLNYGEPGEIGTKVLKTIDLIGDRYAYALGPVLCEIYTDTDLTVEWVATIIKLWIKENQKYSRDGHIDAVSDYLKKQVAVSKKRQETVGD